jgi:hypothetical protein
VQKVREFNETAHRDAAPMPPDAHALARVRGEALVRKARITDSPKSWATPLVAGVIGLALAVGVASVALVPGAPGAASVAPEGKKPQPVFAKALALESLRLPTHGVMHTRRSSPPPVADTMITEVIDEWFDLDAHAYRSETRGFDGKLVELTVMSGGRMTNLWSLDPFSDVAVPLKDSKRSAGQKFGLKTVDHQAALGAKDDLYYQMASEIRSALDSGEASISGPVDYRGTHCWAVDYGNVLADGKPQYRGFLRTGDYSLVCWRQSMGTRSPAMLMQFEHETVERQTLASDFFSLKAPDHAIPAKQIVKRQHVSSLPSPDKAVDTYESVNGD